MGWIVDNGGKGGGEGNVGGEVLRWGQMVAQEGGGGSCLAKKCCDICDGAHSVKAAATAMH